jgi:hypothetical protein
MDECVITSKIMVLGVLLSIVLKCSNFLYNEDNGYSLNYDIVIGNDCVKKLIPDTSSLKISY